MSVERYEGKNTTWKKRLTGVIPLQSHQNGELQLEAQG